MIYLTSDEHYDHARIIRYSERPFDDMHHMQWTLIQRHNAAVQPDDTVWHLGDFTLSEETVPVILKQLNGSHNLLCGNHDKMFEGRKGYEAATKRYIEYGFGEVHHGIIEDFHGFRMCHFPYAGENKDLRYMEYRPKKTDDDRWLLNGHAHQKWAVSIERKAINIGVDAWDYRPVSLDTLIKIREEHSGKGECVRPLAPLNNECKCIEMSVTTCKLGTPKCIVDHKGE